MGQEEEEDVEEGTVEEKPAELSLDMEEVEEVEDTGVVEEVDTLIFFLFFGDRQPQEGDKWWRSWETRAAGDLGSFCVGVVGVGVGGSTLGGHPLGVSVGAGVPGVALGVGVQVGGMWRLRVGVLTMMCWFSFSCFLPSSSSSSCLFLLFLPC